MHKAVSTRFGIILRAGAAVVGFLLLGVVRAATAVAQYPPKLEVGPQEVGPQEVGEQPARAAVEGALPFTGAELVLLVSILAALATIGVLALVAARRRARAA